eukprot:767707_1
MEMICVPCVCTRRSYKNVRELKSMDRIYRKSRNKETTKNDIKHSVASSSGTHKERIHVANTKREKIRLQLHHHHQEQQKDSNNCKGELQMAANAYSHAVCVDEDSMEQDTVVAAAAVHMAHDSGDEERMLPSGNVT